MLELVIVGGGPCGLSCAAYAHKAGLPYVVLEKGSIVHTIARFPTDMRFFSTALRMSIGGVPFVASEPHPTRKEALDYYRQVVHTLGLAVRTFEEVTAISREADGTFRVVSRPHRNPEHANVYQAKAVVVATGYFDWPNRIGVPGEDLPHVSHYYREGHAHYGQRVVVVGGGNSAVEAALDLFRCGAQVTLVHRGGDVHDKVKPWVLPFFRSRVKKGQIATRFGTRVVRIERDAVVVESAGRQEVLEADAVYLLTGFRPDHALLTGLGVTVDGQTEAPVYDPETMETDVPGVYVAGVAAAGRDANRIFIENGRFHGLKIVRHRLALRGMTAAELDERVGPLPTDPDELEDPTFVVGRAP
ncbi:MAG: YpdA family putative bacillithiol disulfide reductase [Bacillota bacterium]|nr:pyridine nucleotide-disulfide oxidoreductase [Bacillota bacterium]